MKTKVRERQCSDCPIDELDMDEICDKCCEVREPLYSIIKRRDVLVDLGYSKRKQKLKRKANE